MNNAMSKWLLAGVVLPCLVFAAAAPARKPDAKNIERYRRVAHDLCTELASNHMWRHGPNDLISRRAWTNLLESCDADHMVFTAADIAEFEKSIDKLDDAFRKGDFSFAGKMRKVFRERLTERTAFATNLLAQGKFDFAGKDGVVPAVAVAKEGPPPPAPETYVFDRKDAPWPAEGAARDALWAKRLKGEVLDEFIEKEKGGVQKAARAVAKSYVDNLKSELKRRQTADYEDFINAIVSAYDAHTLYLSHLQYGMFKSQMDLTLCGIGAQWSMKDGASKIKRVMPGGPLARDGHVHAGDSIIGVAPNGDGKIVKVAGKSESDVVKLFRGKKGTKITLEVKHANGEVKQYTLVRDDVKMDDEAASSKVVEIDVGGVKRKAGYLRLPSFYSSVAAKGTAMRSCSEDLRVELEKLKKAEVCGVLFDLRGNNGGSLDDAVKVIGLFVRSGAAVRMHGPGGDTTLPVPFDAVVCDTPVLVLISRGSASAGELVPGTLQDLGRAVVAGDAHTFGKGSAQTVRQMSGKRNGALVVTDGRFYRVTGASTQFKGVASDILLPSCSDEEMIKGEQGLSYPLPWDELAACEFSPSWDLNRFIPELRAASAARLAKNPAWAKHMQLVKDSEECALRKEMPLELKARKAQLDRDDAVSDEIERMDEKGFKPEKRQDDPVLDEGLNILSDLVRLNGDRKLPAAKPVAAAGVLGGLNDD